MAELYVIGITTLKVGDLETDGGMGLTLAALGKTHEGTASLEQDDPEETEFYCEEQDDPVYKISKQGVKKVLWSIQDWTPATLLKVFGGTVTGTGDSAVWHAPSSNPTIEQSIEIITKTNVRIEFTRASLTAKVSAALSKNDMGVIPIIATILAPTKSGEASMRVTKVVV